MSAQASVKVTVPDAPLWFFVLVSTSILLRAGINPNALNLLVPYTTAGGSILTKLHPGSYGIGAAGLIACQNVLPSTRLKGNPIAICSLLLILSIGAVSSLMLVRGGASAASYLVDSILICPLCLIALARLSIGQRLAVMKGMLGIGVLNATLVFIEFVSKSHLMPYPEIEGVFRPAGLFGHPLQTGVINVTLIGILGLTRGPLISTWVMTNVLLASVVLSQARVATLVATVLALIVLARRTAQEVTSGDLSGPAALVLVICIVSFAPAAIIAAAEIGALERLLSGFGDSSTFARVDIYQIFSLLSWPELLYGMDPAIAYRIAQYRLNIPMIESPLVVFVVQFGIVGTAIFGSSLLLFIVSIATRGPLFAKIVLLAFLAVGLSNNALAAKSPALVIFSAMMFVVLTVSSRQLHAPAPVGNAWRAPARAWPDQR